MDTPAQNPLPDIRAVVFDVGETLVDESRSWTEQAIAAGVRPFTLMSLIGTLIERGEPHQNVWKLLRVAAPPVPPRIQSEDLYPDAHSCLSAASSAGLLVGIAGNQPAGAVERLRDLGFEPAFVASSAEWRIAKPSPEFFTRIIDAVSPSIASHEILYVGDRLDNDVLPAASVGMRTALLRRGPWGHVHSALPEAAVADLRLDSLDELSALVGV